MISYPPRLIEVDLPIKAISAHARREKSIRHGHISTLHIWWARRPLAACRAVLCAALWPDPADEACPTAFRQAAALALANFAEQVRTDSRLAGLCKDHWTRWNRTTAASLRPEDPAAWADLRYALLDFIADFANWDASTIPAFLDTARLLTHVAHLALTGQMPDIDLPATADLQSKIEILKSQIEHSPRPLVVDPFAGGGSIPLEALRIGADAFASDLNPVAVLLNKVVLEYIPKYGAAQIETQDAEGRPISFNGLAEAVRYWGLWVKQQAEQELAQFYPPANLPPAAYIPRLETERKIGGMHWKLNGVAQETPIAYIWARTITCEGPGCGAEVPLMRSLWLAKKSERSIALHLLPDRQAKRVSFELIEKKNGKWYTAGSEPAEVKAPDLDGTMRRGSVTCPVCGYTTPVESVRVQLKPRQGGATDARLVAVVASLQSMRRQIGGLPGMAGEGQAFDESGRFYRLPTEADLEAIYQAGTELARREIVQNGISLIPDEKISLNELRRISVPLYGMENWGSLFTPRQGLVLSAFTQKIARENIPIFIKTLLALVVDRLADANSSLCRWHTTREINTGTFGRQALGMVWDFSEVNAFSESTGGFTGALEWVIKVCDSGGAISWPGQVENASATHHPLSSDIAQGLITDPPYYDAVPYAHLSDFFYVWLRRTLANDNNDLLQRELVLKDEEIVVDRPHSLSNSTHNIEFYERELSKAFAEGRRILAPDGIGTIVFASKTTASWEAILKAVIEAGWTITGSWPIDTEMETRVAAQGQARLASSIHLVCRPREAADGSVPNTVGDWREVLSELPKRIHAWLPRLAQEGVVGADAIFACLGPALEIYSRYSRVETASGEPIPLGDVIQNGKVIQRGYLSFVWEAVSREALGMIFQGADASGFEADARLTAMWLWTLSTQDENDKPQPQNTLEEETEPDSEEKPGQPTSAFTLEYDAARKIAQGLGAHLEKLDDMVTLKGDQARLRTVRERSAHLFGKAESNPLVEKRRPAAAQLDLFSILPESTDGMTQDFNAGETFPAGETTLARLHQAMLLFGSGRSEALKRFLVDSGVGKDGRFWRLAQALSALYPSGSDEKRWVDGVLARKKGLGF